MGHENISDDPRELSQIANCLRRRIGEGRIRVGTLEEELRRVERKVKILKEARKQNE